VGHREVVGVVTVFRHFPTKDALVEEALLLLDRAREAGVADPEVSLDEVSVLLHALAESSSVE
jgi:AcrR family transcriptional regulator